MPRCLSSRWTAVRGLTFPLLADFHPKGRLTRLYGVMRDSNGFSERALYVIKAGGTIRYKQISPKLNHIPDIYQLFEQLQQLAGNVPEAAPTAHCSFRRFHPRGFGAPSDQKQAGAGWNNANRRCRSERGGIMRSAWLRSECRLSQPLNGLIQRRRLIIVTEQKGAQQICRLTSLPQPDSQIYS
jgi:hypothetical protein